MNKITIELCPEDRARLDKIYEALTRDCKDCVSSALKAVQNLATTLGAPAEPTKAEEADHLKQLKKLVEAAEATAETPATDATEPQEATKEETPTHIDPTDTAAPFETVEAPAPSVTLEQIQQKVVQLAALGGAKKAKVREIISAYGSKVSDLKDHADKWGEVWAKLTAVESEG